MTASEGPGHGETLNRGSAVPMYEQLRQRILADIAREGLQPGDALPSEHGLCAQHGVSCTVVRQALARLEQEGRIERIKGSGTFVARPHTAEALVHTLDGLFDEVARRGGQVRSEVRRHRREPASAEVATALGVAPGAPVVVLERLRFVDDQPWSLSTTWLPDDIGALTLGADLREASLYRLLATHGIRAADGVRSAEATVATPEQARMLGISTGAALLRLRSVSRDADGRAIEFFIAHHRGDRSRFEFQLRGARDGDVPGRLRLHRGTLGEEDAHG